MEKFALKKKRNGIEGVDRDSAKLDKTRGVGEVKREQSKQI